MSKRLVEVKRCSKCGRELPKESKARECPYCGGPLITRHVRRREKAQKRKIWHHAMPSGDEVPT